MKSIKEQYIGLTKEMKIEMILEKVCDFQAGEVGIGDVKKEISEAMEAQRKETAADIEDIVTECLWDEWVQPAHPQNFEAGKINMSMLDKEITKYLQKKGKE